jgi:hypothetical protein
MRRKRGLDFNFLPSYRDTNPGGPFSAIGISEMLDQ